MPDDPGPPPHSTRRALWSASAAALGLVVVLAVAILVPRPQDGSSATKPATPVITAAGATAPSDEGTERRRLGPRLRPVEVVPGGRCSLRRTPVLRVLQFNIHFGVSREGFLDLSRIADEIDSVHPDLVSLNEVDSHTFRSRGIDEAGYLAAATGLRAVYGPNLPWQGGLFGNAILTRYPVVASRNLRLPGIPGLEPRGLLTTTLRVGARTVTFASVHLSDGSDGRASRLLQAQAIAAELRDASGPTIVAGDLNSLPGDPPVRILRQYLVDAQEEGGTDSGDTIPEPDPRNRFDYVLYDHHFAVVPGSTRVVPSASSDHRSVLTELTLLPHRCTG